jgi:hypothetical protein
MDVIHLGLLRYIFLFCCGRSADGRTMRFTYRWPRLTSLWLGRNMTSVARRPQSNANLGGEQAEADPLLEFVFYHSGDYETIESRLDPRCFIIGGTGSGKSAAFQHLEEMYGKRGTGPRSLIGPYCMPLHGVELQPELQPGYRLGNRFRLASILPRRVLVKVNVGVWPG